MTEAAAHRSPTLPTEATGDLRITDVRVVLHDRRSDVLNVFGRADGALPMGVLVLTTNVGIEGNSFLSFPGPGPAAVGAQIVNVLKPLLVGANPLDIGALWTRMTSIARWYLDPIAVGAVDIALWDVAGKVAGLPIHRLLGTCREVVPAYFSSGRHASAQEYAEEAVYWREQGWKGYKLHPPTAPFRQTDVPIQADIDACTAVRASVAQDMTLMLDSSWGYSYSEALRVGQAIEELAYHWYEDPLPAEDIYGYRRLKKHLHIPILATELTSGGLYALPQWILQEATDFLRGDVVIKGGITGMMKIAHLAEAFHMKCEVHDAYNALSNVASLHVIMANNNCDWFEVITFNKAGHYGLEHLSYGLEKPIEIDGDGQVHAPAGAGLGCEVDWELINHGKVGEIQ
jgi:L-alanine-DL-glutamate epimerase-like enolase superfamily enzyme